jgi:1,2-phenylacetyl-CoA epoxidase PaaB subunit
MATLAKSTGKKIAELIKEARTCESIGGDYWEDANKAVEGTQDEFIRRRESNYWEVRSIDALITLWEEYNINLTHDDDDNEETLKALKERKQNRERYTEFLDIQIDQVSQEESEEEAVA